MKRLLTTGLMLASALVFTNCTEQLVSTVEYEDIIVGEVTNIPQEEGVPYEVFIEAAETKLQYQNDGYYWQSNTDKISLYSNPSDNKDEVTSHGAFTYDGNGKFVGSLQGTLANYNDWYCVYPSSAGTTTLSNHKVTIGSASSDSNGNCILSQEGNNKSHLAGPEYPMYAIKNKISKDNAPRFHITPMYSLVALKFINQGDGQTDSKNGDPNVVINNVTFTAPEEVFGTFNVNILGDLNANGTFTKVSGEPSYHTAKIAFTNTSKNLEIPTTNARTVYFAVKPFDPAGRDIKISVNGSTKTFKLPSNVKFEAGKQITLEIPLTHVKGSKVTDAFEKKSGGLWGLGAKTVFNFGNFKNPSTKKINGENVPVYTIGTADAGGTITIEAFPKDLASYLPASFYAASYGSGQAIMRLNKVAVSILGYDIELTYSQLSSMAPINLINFTGLIPLEPSADDVVSTGNIIMLDEEPYHKGLSVEAVNNLLARFDTYPNDPYDDKVPTLAGLQKGLNNIWDNESETTFDIIFEKAKYSLQNNTNEMIGKVKTLLNQGYKAVCLELLVASITVKVELATVSKGTTVELSKNNKVTATDSRVVVWGIDVN